MSPRSDSIGDWDQATLIKFIQDILRDQATSSFSFLKVDDLVVKGTLQVEDKLVMTKDTRLHLIGKPGEPAFTNSWINFSTTELNAGYWRDSLGNINLQGVIKSGTLGSAAFTLPPGYRPPANAPFSVISNGAVGLVTVGSNGTVTPASPSSNLQVSLNGIVFRPA